MILKGPSVSETNPERRQCTCYLHFNGSLFSTPKKGADVRSAENWINETCPCEEGAKRHPSKRLARSLMKMDFSSFS